MFHEVGLFPDGNRRGSKSQMVEAHRQIWLSSLGGIGQTYLINDIVRIRKGSEMPRVLRLYAEAGQACPWCLSFHGVNGRAGVGHAPCYLPLCLDVLKSVISACDLIIILPACNEIVLEYRQNNYIHRIKEGERGNGERNETIKITESYNLKARRDWGHC